MNLNSGTFGYELALKDSVNSDASIVTERNGFGPGEAFLEKDVLKVCTDKGVLNRVAIIIKSLHHVCSPAFVQFKGSSEENLIELDQ